MVIGARYRVTFRHEPFGTSRMVAALVSEEEDSLVFSARGMHDRRVQRRNIIKLHRTKMATHPARKVDADGQVEWW